MISSQPPATSRALFQIPPALTQAQREWSAVAIRERIVFLRRFRAALVEDALLLAGSAASGRTAAEVLAAEILPLAEACRFLERNAEDILASRQMSATDRPIWLRGVEVEVHRESLGIILVVAASNYSLFLPGVQILQALAAGNAVLVKPAPWHSSSAEMLINLCRQSGMGELVRVLDESPETVREVIQEGVAKVFFTGSEEAGKAVLAEAASHTTPSVMELSGCDAFIVTTGANISAAAKALRFGLELNNGQTCIRPARVLVQNRLLPTFLNAMRREQPHRSVQLSGAQKTQMVALLSKAQGGGAEILWGSVESALLLRIETSRMQRWCSETMLPLAVLCGFDEEGEAVSLVNEARFRLGATIFAGEAEARKLASHLKVGEIVVNDMVLPTADPRLPFGGQGASGFGVTRGREGLLEMTAVKAVAIRRTTRWYPHFDKPRTSDERLFLSTLQAVHAGTLLQRWRGIMGVLSTIIGRLRSGR